MRSCVLARVSQPRCAQPLGAPEGDRRQTGHERPSASLGTLESDLLCFVGVFRLVCEEYDTCLARRVL